MHFGDVHLCQQLCDLQREGGGLSDAFGGPWGAVGCGNTREQGFCTVRGPGLCLEESVVRGDQLAGRTARGLQVLSCLSSQPASPGQDGPPEPLMSPYTGPAALVYCQGLS